MLLKILKHLTVFLIETSYGTLHLTTWTLHLRTLEMIRLLLGSMACMAMLGTSSSMAQMCWALSKTWRWTHRNTGPVVCLKNSLLENDLKWNLWYLKKEVWQILKQWIHSTPVYLTKISTRLCQQLRLQIDVHVVGQLTLTLGPFLFLTSFHVLGVGQALRQQLPALVVLTHLGGPTHRNSVLTVERSTCFPESPLRSRSNGRSIFRSKQKLQKICS